jgi:hypothetical protein
LQTENIVEWEGDDKMDQCKEFDTMFGALDDSGRHYVLGVIRNELERIRKGRQLSCASLHLQLVSSIEVVPSLPKSKIYPLTVVRTS